MPGLGRSPLLAPRQLVAGNALHLDGQGGAVAARALPRRARGADESVPFTDELQPHVIVHAESPDDLASAATDEAPSHLLDADFPAAGDAADRTVAQLRDLGRWPPGDAFGEELHRGGQPPP